MAAGRDFEVDEPWLDTLVLAAAEAVHRSRAESRARRSELACSTLQREATLGRYMLEMRHSLNNALTSVLGNSDLLLLEPGSLVGPDPCANRDDSQYGAAHSRNHAALLVTGEGNERSRAAGRAGFGKGRTRPRPLAIEMRIILPQGAADRQNE